MITCKYVCDLLTFRILTFSIICVYCTIHCSNIVQYNNIMNFRIMKKVIFQISGHIYDVIQLIPNKLRSFCAQNKINVEKIPNVIIHKKSSSKQRSFRDYKRMGFFLSPEMNVCPFSTLVYSILSYGYYILFMNFKIFDDRKF